MFSTRAKVVLYLLQLLALKGKVNWGEGMGNEYRSRLVFPAGSCGFRRSRVGKKEVSGTLFPGPRPKAKDQSVGWVCWSILSLSFLVN